MHIFGIYPVESLVKKFLQQFPESGPLRDLANVVAWRCRGGKPNHLRRFDGRHAGADCFILGNGPSLKHVDLEKLQNRYVFGLNKIHLHPLYAAGDIDYRVAVNPFVIEQSREDFLSEENTVFLAEKPAREHGVKGRDVHLIRHDGGLGFGRTMSSNFGEGFTVTYVAMQIAYAMGFRRVFLVGVDHSFKQKGKPNETQTMEGEDGNHFAPNYFAGKQWQLADLEASEVAYRIAKFWFERDGREIIDATDNGKLDVFPKVDFMEALDRCAERS